MTTNYTKIINANLDRIFQMDQQQLAAHLPAEQAGDAWSFKAFGQECLLSPQQVCFAEAPDHGPKALLITLYALKANPAAVQLEPFRAFRDLPGTEPYQQAYKTHSEAVLNPYVACLHAKQPEVLARFDGQIAPAGIGGDFSLVLYPLPKIALGMVFYLPDEDFSASTTSLFSANAQTFMPVEGLADVAEYTAKVLIDLVR